VLLGALVISLQSGRVETRYRLTIRNLFPFDLAIQLVKRPPLFGALRNLVVTPVPQQNIERKNHASHCAGEGRSVNVP
jgi:hypothetical protein